MNPISKAASVIIHPVRTATAVAGQTMGVASAGVRATMRIIDRAAGQGRGDSSTGWSTTGPAAAQGGPETSAAPEARTSPANAGSDGVGPASNPATDTAPAKKETAKKARPRKSAAKKAPSARAATVGPALSETALEAIENDELRTPSGIPAADEGHNPDTAETDLHQPGTEPLMDPATVKSVRSEAEVMQRAADTDKD